MAQIPWGRKARVYISTAAFTAAGLVMVRRCKDITTTDEADDQVAEARDLEYKIHNQGAKDFTLEFDKLLDAAADVDAGDNQLLKASYDNGTELFVVVCPGLKTDTVGHAMQFKGIVMSWSPDYPEGEASKVSVKIAPSDPDSPPARVATPLS